MKANTVLDLKAFVPSKDHALSRQFYLDLGFTLNWSNDQVAEFQAGNSRFFLQNYYDKQYAENCMLQLMVSDADAWWQLINDHKLVDKYPGVKAQPPALQPWGLRVLFLHDPSGVLWHIADNPDA